MVKKSMKIAIIVVAAILIIAAITIILSRPTQPPNPPAVITNKLIALAVFDNGVTVLNATTMAKINYASAPFPLVSSYVLASDEHFLYVGFIDLNAETPANIWRINSTGSYIELALPGYTNYGFSLTCLRW
jgi:hypothetical protein